MLNFKLINSTRNTSHLNHRCGIKGREAKLMQDIGLAQILTYQCHDFDKVWVIDVVYDDNMILPNQVVGMKDDGNILTITHISSRGAAASWSMTFKRIKED